MIAGNLEYLISSLPSLYFQNTGDFRKSVSGIFEKYSGKTDEEADLLALLNDEAAKFLTKNEYDVFCNVSLSSITDESFLNNSNSLLSGFSKFNCSLRESIMQLRLSRRDKKSGSGSRKEQDSIITPGNPLEEEIQIMKHQWDALEELSIGHFSDFSALLAYRLKLMILIRWWSFNKEKGFGRFDLASKPVMKGGKDG